MIACGGCAYLRPETEADEGGESTSILCKEGIEAIPLHSYSCRSLCASYQSPFIDISHVMRPSLSVFMPKLLVDVTLICHMLVQMFAKSYIAILVCSGNNCQGGGQKRKEFILDLHNDTT
jgi:hypothetical protein